MADDKKLSEKKKKKKLRKEFLQGIKEGSIQISSVTVKFQPKIESPRQQVFSEFEQWG